MLERSATHVECIQCQLVLLLRNAIKFIEKGKKFLDTTPLVLTEEENKFQKKLSTEKQVNTNEKEKRKQK